MHHFPVFQASALVGFVCTCDIEHAPPKSHVGAWMHRNVVSVPPSATLSDTARLLAERAVGSALVVDGAGLQGIVTREDLARASAHLPQSFDEQRCEACGARRHLQAARDGGLLCSDCAHRAKHDEWFELGAGG